MKSIPEPWFTRAVFVALAAVFVAAPGIADACVARPPPPSAQEEIETQNLLRVDAYAIALGRVELTEGRESVFKTVIALKGAPPMFDISRRPGGGVCTRYVQPEVGELAILYFLPRDPENSFPERAHFVRLTDVADPRIGVLLRAAAERARSGHNHLIATDRPSTGSSE